MTERVADSFQVSPYQEQLWLAEPEGPTGRLQAVLALDGPLDADFLRAALRRVIDRHEILRTSFVHQPGIRVPLQAVSGTLEPNWRTMDMRDAVSADRLAEIKEICVAEVSEPLQFSCGPLLRTVLVSWSDEQHTLVLTVPSLCADASSMVLLVGELVAAYGGTGDAVEDPLQYADYAAWQRELQATDDDERRSAARYWTEVEGLTAASLPFAARSSAGSFVFDDVAVALDAATAEVIAAQALRYGATPRGFAQAAWHALLGRISGEESIAASFLGPARRHADLDGALGSFARPVPISTKVSDAVTFAEVLREVEQARDEASVWQDHAPTDKPVCPEVAYLDHDSYRGRANGLEVRLERLMASDPQVRVWLTCAEGQGECSLRLSFDPHYLDRESAERIARQLEQVLQAAAANPGIAVGDLQLLDETERARVLVEFNDTAAVVPDGCIHELFGACATVAGERDAVLDESGSLTYSELDRRSSQLAHRLRRCGVGPDVTVGLCTDRSVEMVVGLLGILKAGGAYVPLHYEHPPARLGHQLATAGARAVVTQDALLERLPQGEAEIVCLDRDRGALDAESSTAPEVSVTHDNLAYVIYTSGSTGTPKGVAVTHGNLINYAADISRRVGADEQPLAFGMVTSISTDLGNTAVFGALCSGGSLVLISPVAAADPGALVRQLENTPVDVLKITPSHAGALIAGGDARVLPRRWLVIGGERAPWDLVTRVRSLSDCAILNHYGPTEATVGCCTFTVGEEPGRYRPTTVPIGRPIANTSCYVLDVHRRPLPIGVRGRLFIGGGGVARGYIDRPELTDERFIDDPFAPNPGARMYDTGDEARWLPDGALEFLGRADEQVKIRGYRVEPAEVEMVLRDHPHVREAVIVARASDGGDTRLLAYCTARDGIVTPDELRRHLADWLPEFMLPSAIVILDALPLTTSGKVDRLALPDPHGLGHVTSERQHPSTPLEHAVAKIWSQVLGVEEIGLDDDFFALGGHSLLATQVVAQVRSDFAIDLPLHSLFTYPTVASLAAELARLMGESEADETARLVAELEGLSDAEAEQLLAAGPPPPEHGASGRVRK